MSHNKLRKETNCLNCAAEVDGRYCKNCGQENTEPRQTTWQFFLHFIADLTHFDGRFFGTLKTLLLHPGFLSEEYIKGRRVKYLDPIRMYLFISGTFFLLYLSIQIRHYHYNKFTYPEMTHFIDSVRANTTVEDTDILSLALPNRKKIYIHLWNDKYQHGYKYYDSLQHLLPEQKRDGTFDRFWAKREISAFEFYNKDPYNANKGMWDTVNKSLSKLFFFSLPVFAFFLYMMYYRRRKELYYPSHVIFSLHYYAIVWLFLLLAILFNRGLSAIGVVVNRTYITVPLFIGLVVYMYVAMLRFYKQGKLITLLKTIMLIVLTFMVIALWSAFLYFKSYGYF